MNNRWNDSEARACGDDPLQLRVYTSRLLGQEPSLVLDGGGNTSVKLSVRTFLGDEVEVVYVKGSGHDLGTIDVGGFAPVRRDVLLRLAEMDHVTDSEIVREQRAGMLDPSAPNPSVEAILHALVPYRFVDHTHADPVLTISNTPRGPELIRELYGERVLVLPYVMAGFKLAKAFYHATRGIDWSALDAMILLHHGIFTFADEARQSYDRMIALVSQAEDYLRQQGALDAIARAAQPPAVDLEALCRIRRAVSQAAGQPMLARLEITPESQGFASLPNVADLTSRGNLTPDHVSRIKHTPALIGGDIEADIARFADDYRAYFARYAEPRHLMLDPAPRWGVWRGIGTLAFGPTVKNTETYADIARHTVQAIQQAEHLGGWRVPSEDHFFDMEYWELQQAKFKPASATPPLQGRIALVACADEALGQAIAAALHKQGAAVLSLTNAPGADKPGLQTLSGDPARPEAVRAALEAAVRQYGGLDLLIAQDARTLAQGQAFLRLGLDPAAILIGGEALPALDAGVRGVRIALGEGRAAPDVAAIVARVAESTFHPAKTVIIG
jgi:rhamnose utilization protein RhaD (predicted bifunctional aldolase and dehydrogenase)